MGKVTAEYRSKYSIFGDGTFPIHDKSDAADALGLRGHAGSKERRRKIIRAAARYVPKAAKKALEDDKKKGLV